MNKKNETELNESIRKIVGKIVTKKISELIELNKIREVTQINVI